MNKTANASMDSPLLDSMDENNAVKIRQNIFKRPRLPLQENFNVSFQDSNVETTAELGLETSAAFLKKEPNLFGGEEPSPQIDPFKSLHNVTSPTLSQELKVSQSEQSDPTIVQEKINPFKGENDQTSNFSVNFDQTKNSSSDVTSNFKKTLFKNNTTNSDPFQVTFSEPLTPETNKEKMTQDSEEATIVPAKSNPFKELPEESIRDPFQIDFDESTVDTALLDHSHSNSIFRNASHTEKNFNVSYETTTSQKKLMTTLDEVPENLNKNHETSTSKEIINDAEMLDPGSNKDTEETLREEMTGGMALTKSVTKQNLSTNSNQQSQRDADSTSVLNQSSFNDENLKYWVSDNSEDEILPPSVPAIPGSNLQTLKNTSVKQTTLPLSWVEKFNKIVTNANQSSQEGTITKNKVVKKPNEKVSQTLNRKKPLSNQNQVKVKSQKLIKPRGFISERLYPYLIAKLDPKFGIQSKIEAEKLVISISDVVKKVIRRKDYQKKLIGVLKKQLAEAGIIETTVDFYQFVRQFLPFDFRIKVIPSIQPVNNIIYPPKDTTNPFDKIL